MVVDKVDAVEVGVNECWRRLNWSLGHHIFLFVVVLVLWKLILLFILRIVRLILRHAAIVFIAAVLFFFIFGTTRVKLAR